MMEIIADVQSNLATYFPAYNGQGFEIIGFGWHQGWNGRVNAAYTAEYEENMANFINDVRFELGRPDLPFVIATTGMGEGSTYTAIELAQLELENYTTYPEYDGNVAVVDTKSFWRTIAESPTDQIYHWNRNAETYYLIGESMAQEMVAMVDLNPPVDTTASTPNPITWASAPAAASASTITMTATTATDDLNGVFYKFICTAGGSHDSGWQASNTYTDTGLTHQTQYTYTVQMRDGLLNTGTASAPATATTTATTTAAAIWSIPFVETFESLTPGTLNGQHGWVAEGVDVQTDVIYGGSAKAGAVTEDGGYIHHTFSDARTRVWTDMRLRVVHTEVPPTPEPDSTVAVYVSTNSQVMVFDGINAVASGQTADEGEWVRFTILTDYTTATWMLYVDDLKAGPFRFFDPTSSGYSELTLKGGQRFVDDLLITETNIYPVYASGGTITPLGWVQSYGGDPTLVNQDGDGLTLDQEYLIETDPTISNKFEIIALGFMPGNSPYLQYNANGLPNGTLNVSNCTDLMVGSWGELAGTLSIPASNVVHVDRKQSSRDK